METPHSGSAAGAAVPDPIETLRLADPETHERFFTSPQARAISEEYEIAKPYIAGMLSLNDDAQRARSRARKLEDQRDAALREVESLTRRVAELETRLRTQPVTSTTYVEGVPHLSPADLARARALRAEVESESVRRMRAAIDDDARKAAQFRADAAAHLSQIDDRRRALDAEIAKFREMQQARDASLRVTDEIRKLKESGHSPWH